MEYSSRSSKSHKVRYFLPSVRPSYLSLTLLFACGILWLKNEATNDRLLVLETRLTMLPLNERAVDNLPKATHEGKSDIQTENSAELFEAKRLGPPSGLPVFTKVPPSLATPEHRSSFQETCEAKGFPTPKISWIRLPMPFPAGKTEVKDGRLIIRNLSPVDSGFYECVATNSMGTKKARMNLVVQRVYCDCWRSRSKRPYSHSSIWGYGGLVDAIDFQTDGVVILQGYRLWGVTTGSTSFQVTIGLYRGSTLIAEKTGSYSTSSSNPTFEVRFNQVISIRAGVTYTATAKINTSKLSFYMKDGMASTLCAGVTITFNSSSKDGNGSSRSRGQIPALIFGSSQC